jgi:pyrroline-5-carboxylate reductase
MPITVNLASVTETARHRILTIFLILAARIWSARLISAVAACPGQPLVLCCFHHVLSFTMTETTLAFIGGGNMTGSLVGGLIADGWKPARIHVAEPDPQQAERLSRRFSVMTTADNRSAVKHADAVVLAVKPQVIRTVAEDLAPIIRERHPLVISIAAGIRETSLRDWLGEDTAIVRAMPNTPALVQSGASALYANPAVSEQQRSLAESILRAVGIAIWVDDEAMMDTVTALSGSGPAYFFLLMEALTSAGSQMGLPEDTARLLALQTAFGAAKMALESADDAAQLRRRVTSPGGTTERAISEFQKNNFERIVLQALQAAAERSRELAAEFGKG